MSFEELEKGPASHSDGTESTVEGGYRYCTYRGVYVLGTYGG